MIPFRIAVIWLAALLCLAGCAETPKHSDDEAPPLLLISIDGFRHDYMELTELPALARLANEGLRADSLMHVFPTKTFATHYALVTGSFAENSGVVANSMWDPVRKSRFSLGNRDAVADGYWYDAEPIWNTVEKAGKIAATYFWPGSEAQIDGIRPSFWKVYAHNTPHDERVDQVLSWLDLPAAERPDFLTLYFSVVDSAGHRYGPASAQALSAAAEVDRSLEQLLQGLAARDLLGEMHILVTSDHGMAEIDLERYVLLDEFLRLDRVNVSDWGPAAQVWTVEDGPDADEIVAAIDPDHPGIRQVWKKGQGPARYRFDDHQRVPDVTIEAELGWMLSNKPYFAGMQRGLLRGMHGWDPAWHEMHGIFIAHGPAFAAGDTLPAVRSVDLYSLMAHLMKIPTAATDGHLDPFETLLQTEAPLQAEQRQWQCDETTVTTRSVPGLTAVHIDGKVLALPAVKDARGELHADADVELRVEGDQATLTLDGQRYTDCRLLAP